MVRLGMGLRCGAFGSLMLPPAVPALSALALFAALAACTELPTASRPDAAPPAKEGDAPDLHPPASVEPVLPSLPELADDLPLPDLVDAAATARTYHMRRESTVYDFRLEVGLARPRSGNEVVGPRGDLTIFHKGTSQVVQRIHIASLAERASNFDYEPSILVEDFDFDGHEDFAVHTGDFGPYGAASYTVFLFAPASRTFAHSPALSRLAETSLSPMRTDAARKRLVIASKSGCCVHWFEEYEVHHGIPRLMKRETEETDSEDRCVVTLETRRRGGALRCEKRPCP